MFQVADLDTFYDSAPGAYIVRLCVEKTCSYKHIWLKLPNGSISALPLTPNNTDRPSWDWDHDELAPTLSPSVLNWISRGGVKQESWHGFVTKGRMESC